MEYIDIHNHTLFGVDDGPNHIQESLDMLREADLQGIREIILTPHYRHGMFRYELDEIERNFAELLKQVEENQINVRLYLGCEYHVDSDIFEHIQEGRVHTLADTEYVLTEYIGNGFDLMHGAHSSYYDFEKTLGKHSYLRFILENYLEADDLWADFEGALAKINVEAMSQPYILNDLLEAMVHMMRMHKPRIFLLQQKWQHHRLQSFPGSCDIDLSGGSIPCRCEQRIIR